jgi:ribosomal protein L37AE/L43A
MMLKPANFIPICPLCGEPMPVIKGQKKGAWNCLKCGSQFWDEVEEVMLGEPDQTDQKILCLRCKLPMIPYQGVWYCEQCYGQFWSRERAPEVEKIVDQMVECKAKQLSKTIWGRKGAKKKHSSKSGKGRKKKPKLDKFYYFE